MRINARACAHVLNATFGKVLRTHEFGVELSDRFLLLPQYKQGHAFSGQAATQGPGAGRGRGERGRGRWGESLSRSGWSSGGKVG